MALSTRGNVKYITLKEPFPEKVGHKKPVLTMDKFDIKLSTYATHLERIFFRLAKSYLN